MTGLAPARLVPCSTHKTTGTVEYIDSLYRYIGIDDTEITLASITEIEAYILASRIF